MSRKKCNHCREWKDEEEFNWRFKSSGIRNKSCGDCQHALLWSKMYQGKVKSSQIVAK